MFKMAKKKKKLGNLSLTKLRGKYGSGCAKEISIESDKLPWLPSTSPSLNNTLGGGIPFGRILELYGTYSSGKSLIAYDFAWSTQQLGGHVLWVDAENVWTESWAEKNSIDTDRVELLNDISIENISDWIAEAVTYYRKELTNNQPILLVIDSTAALDTDATLNESQMDAKAEMGGRAKALYKMLRVRNKMLTELGVCSIFINQLRDKVGASNYEDPTTTVGGKALEFFASQRLAVFGGKAVRAGGKSKGPIVGKEVSVRIHKNKVAPPRATYKTEIYFTDEYGDNIGMNPNMGLYDKLMDSGIITKKNGSHKVYLGDNEDSICLGEKGFYKMLDEDDEWLDDHTDINSVQKTQDLLDSMDSNLYVVTEEGSDDEE